MHTLTKYDLKILQYLYRSKKVSAAKLRKHFHKQPDRIEALHNLGYIERDYEIPANKNGFRVGSVPDSALYWLSDLGMCEAESHQWFGTEYVVSHILVPIILSIISTLLTIFLSSVLSTCL